MWGTRLVIICIQQVGTDNSWCVCVFTMLAWCILGTCVHICLQATGLSCICVCQKSRTIINTHTFLRLSYSRNASGPAKTHTQGVLSHYHASLVLLVYRMHTYADAFSTFMFSVSPWSSLLKRLNKANLAGLSATVNFFSMASITCRTVLVLLMCRVFMEPRGR